MSHLTAPRRSRFRLVMRDDLRNRVIRESGEGHEGLRGFIRLEARRIRSIDAPITIWKLPDNAGGAT